jgi:hypothetical protein
MIGGRISKRAIQSITGGGTLPRRAVAAASVCIVALAGADTAQAAQRMMSMMSGMRGASTGYTGGDSARRATPAREIWARMAAWATGSGDWVSALFPE